MVQAETFDLCKAWYNDTEEATKLKPLSSKISLNRFRFWFGLIIK